MKLTLSETTASVAHEKKVARIVDLGLTDYTAAYRLQLELVDKRRNGTAEDDLFLVTEHQGTFTLGRRGGRQNLTVSEEFLRKNDIPLVHIERGGDITYHGQGQLVIYPIIHLRQAGITVVEYVDCLEELMIRLAAASGVVATRDPRNRGVWVGDKKLGSVGIAIRQGVCFHGMALNINISLEPFSWVNPCGLTGVQMTTLSGESDREVTLEDVKSDLAGQLGRVFARKFITIAKDHPDVTMYQQ
ncbi:MAG: lipoyl(octanoyl) transferase LipB [Desulfobacterales bacterium]|nr:lipoyl(octanoyl) transferase LipB [Desulfobacterales bacterium]